MENRKITILNGSTTVLEAYEYYDSSAVNFVTSMDGWDNAGNVNIETEPKLTSAGSYIISTKVEEREITISINHEPASGDARTLPNSLRSLMMNFTPLTVSRVYLDGSSEVRRETLTGLIRSVGITQVDGNSEIELVMLFTNPLKSIYLGGSTTLDSVSL